MTSEICGATAKSTGEPCQRPAGWGTDSSEGRCKFHGGGTPTKEENPDQGAPEANQNAQTHSLYSLPEHLKANFTEQQQDRYTAYFEALCTRYQQRHGQEPDAFAKDRISRTAIECVKERIADEYLSNHNNGNLLVDDYTIGFDQETMQEVTVAEPNKILGELTALKRETRLTLKDMGLLRDPESQKAEAAEKALSEILTE